MKKITEETLKDITIEYLSKLDETTKPGYDFVLIRTAFTFGLTYALSIKQDKQHPLSTIVWKYFDRCGEVNERHAFEDGYNKGIELKNK